MLQLSSREEFELLLLCSTYGLELILITLEVIVMSYKEKDWRPIRYSSS